ncbi:hypothetical protein YC2023_073259 [Brassica napus]
MRTLSWNCRGLGSDSTVRRLKEIDRKYLPDIICLSETKQPDDYVRDVGAQLGSVFSVLVPPVGIGGGLVIFFKHHVQLSVISSSANLIDCKVSCNENQFYLSFVYGHPNQAFRHYTWEQLMRIGINRKREPWFALGDFNEIVSNQEKIGGRVRPEASFHDFGSMMRTCGFTDLQSVGDRFSWAGQRGSHLVRCCLDRTMATGSWFDLFPVSHTEYLEMGESDHRPMITFMSAEREKPRRFFRYDNRMLHKEGFKDTVRRGWCGMGQSQLVRIPLTQRISRCRQHISQWKRLNRNNAEERISSLRNKLDNAVTSTAFSTEERNAIKDDLNQAYLEEEIYWKQKSRITWLRSGDRNTRYFHAVTKARRTRNTISSIQDEHGVIRKGHKEVAEVATTYFQNLFSSEEINLNLYNEVFLGFTPRVTQDMNDDLTKPITEEEVQAALFDMGPHRAPGPDGFSAVFYQKFWSECKADIMEEIDKFFNTGELDQQHNHTNLCLIPKIYPPTGMKEFRPIALCNVSYKIISKILVNRLKTHLPNIISEYQNAFIPGRLISDNIVVAHEIFHSLKARKRQSNSYMAVKTDITKAYDRLEWKFLQETMQHMGFGEKWISWIMACAYLQLLFRFL